MRSWAYPVILLDFPCAVDMLFLCRRGWRLAGGLESNCKFVH